jgi:hypothetical protein
VLDDAVCALVWACHAVIAQKAMAAHLLMESC